MFPVEKAVLGQGTWRMGGPEMRREEVAALRLGVELGLTLVDTAEIYNDGDAEHLVGEALADRRDDLFIVSKVAPQNAGRDRIVSACEASLRRLKTDRIDLYLLHWRDHRPLGEIVEGMEALKADGKIGAWGVSNFDVADMEQLIAADGVGCAANQIAYNLCHRGVEFDLLPWLAGRGMAAMAYSPLDKARLLGSPVLAEIGRRHDVTPATVALAFTLRLPGMISIPKASKLEHVHQAHAATRLQLTAEDLADLDAAFAPPTAKMRLVLL